MESVLGPLSSIPLSSIPLGEGRSFKVLGECVAVFRTRNGELFAAQATCPHRGGPLADGILGSAKLICPLHSWTFDLRNGEALVGESGLKTYSVRLNTDQKLVVLL
jgi:nitrite reductase (NADH) small subunit